MRLRAVNVEAGRCICCRSAGVSGVEGAGFNTPHNYVHLLYFPCLAYDKRHFLCVCPDATLESPFSHVICGGVNPQPDPQWGYGA